MLREIRRLEVMNEAMIDAGRSVVAERDHLRVALDTAVWAFQDAMLALDELGHQDVSVKLQTRWKEITNGRRERERRGRNPEDTQTPKGKGSFSVG